MNLSKRQRSVINGVDAGPFLTLLGGAIRGGKTWVAVLSFLIWSQLREKGNAIKKDYIIAGRTLTSLERNVMPAMREHCFLFNCYLERNRSYQYVKINGVTYWLVGVNDARAQDKIQGMTAAGALVDEIVLLTEDFWNQLLSRLSVEGSRLWATYNPDNPGHWFKKTVVDQLDRYNGEIVQFSMDDNPTLAEETKQRYREQFAGHFKSRFIDGDWAAPYGLIYPMMVGEDIDVEEYDKLAFSMDYAHAGVWSVIEWRQITLDNRKIWVASGEIYRDWRNTLPLSDEEMVDLVYRWIDDRPYSAVYIDPATYKSWKRAARGVGMKISWPRVERNQGIKLCQALLFNKTVRVTNNCPETLSEAEIYSWDEKAVERGEDEPLKGNDHAMDAFRYFVTGALWGQTRILEKPRSL